MPSMLGWSGRLWRREGARASLMASASQGCSLADWLSVRAAARISFVCRHLLWRWASATRPMRGTDRRTRVTTAKTTRWHLLIYWRDGRAAAGLPYPLPSRMSSAACSPRPPHLTGCLRTPQGSLRGVWRDAQRQRGCRRAGDPSRTRAWGRHTPGRSPAVPAC